MEKYIPYEKLSKKKKRELNSARRNTWGSMSPVTRKPANSKAYNRRKAQNWKHDCLPDSVPSHFFTIAPHYSSVNRLFSHSIIPSLRSLLISADMALRSTAR